METTSARPVIVEPGGSGVVAHVGLHALCSFADRLGFGTVLSSVIPKRSERFALHDRGKVLVQLMAVIAGGGESCSDIEYLRSEPSLFGFVPSDSTVWRTFHEITPATRQTLKGAVAEVRAEVWGRSAATSGTDPVTLDVDASLVTIHTDQKPGTGPTYKGGWGFHPLLVFADATGECLSGMLRYLLSRSKLPPPQQCTPCCEGGMNALSGDRDGFLASAAQDADERTFATRRCRSREASEASQNCFACPR